MTATAAHALRTRTALAVAVTCVGLSAILIRWCTSSPETVAFWRLALVVPALAAIAARREAGRDELARAVASPAVAAAGGFLALHFVLWIHSLSATSVAASTFLLAIQLPVAGLVSWLALGEPPGRRGMAGLGLSLLGLVALAGSDWLAHGFTSSVGRGDAMALASGVAYVGYVGIGRRMRQRTSIVPYLAAVNAWGAAGVALSALVTSASLAPSRASDWWLLALIAAVPTLGGHGLFNYCLARVRVYVVNLAVMGEPVVASALAWLLLAEPPPPATWLAAPLIVGGAALALREKVDG